MEIPQYHKRPVAAASSANEVMSSFKPILERSRHQCNECRSALCSGECVGRVEERLDNSGGFLIYLYLDLDEPKKIMSSSCKPSQPGPHSRLHSDSQRHSELGAAYTSLKHELFLKRQYRYRKHINIGVGTGYRRDLEHSLNTYLHLINQNLVTKLKHVVSPWLHTPLLKFTNILIKGCLLRLTKSLSLTQPGTNERWTQSTQSTRKLPQYKVQERKRLIKSLDFLQLNVTPRTPHNIWPQILSPQTSVGV